MLRLRQPAVRPRLLLETLIMPELTRQGRQMIDNAARRNGIGGDAALTLLRALALGHGSQAQFNHPDLGGMGQWSQGGMIMIGDMFNQGLKQRVDALCRELADILRNDAIFERATGAHQSQSQSGGDANVSLFVREPGASSHNWWPDGLGNPSSTGSQNDLQYACFPAARRLAIRQGGRVSLYDTGEHQINGFSQQQSGDQSLTFTSQRGLVRIAELTLITPETNTSRAADNDPHPQSSPFVAPVERAARAAPAEPAAGDVFAMIERLADLRQKNILSEEEFAAKKTELLSRL
ncbi:MAG: SHOCT domain-containing protein [Methylocella sp.]